MAKEFKMTERRFTPVAATRKAALATFTSILKGHVSLAILLLFMLAATTNAHATATATTTTLKAGLTSAPATAITTAANGASVTLTAAVSPSAAAGTMTFKSGTTTLGTCTLSAGTCQSAFTTLPLGSNSLTAAYTATGVYAASASAAASVVVTSATTTTLSSSVTTAVVGSSVTLTATVSPSAATGTVTFKSGTTTLGTCALSGGTCHSAFTTLAKGSNALTAVYAGNGTYLTSTSPDPVVTMTAAATTTTLKAGLTSAPATAITTAAYGASVTLTSTVTPSAAAGTVTFMTGATTLGSPVTVSSGSATLATTALALGANSLTAVFNPTTPASYAASTSTASTVTVSQATTTSTLVVGLTSAPAAAITSAAYGVSVTLTSTVSPAAEAGTVTFYNGGTSGTALCSSISPNGSGVATCATTTLPVGSNSLTSVFTPTTSADDTASTSTAKTVSITQATATTTLAAGLTSAPSTAITTTAYGASVTLTATVSPSTAPGTETFKYGTNSLACSPVTVTSGTAACVTTALPLGANSLTATFTPTTAADYTSTASAAKTVTVSQATTSTALSAALSSAPSTVVTTAPSGASVTLTASVSPAAAAGTVTFKNNGVAMGSAVTVSSGIATLVTSALTTPGATPLTAVFTPTTALDDTASTSGTVSFTVTKPATTTALAVSAGPYYYDASLTLTATVSASAATGTVTFYDNGVSVGTGSLSSGTATLSLSSFAVGTHPITVTYAGNTSYAGSTSSATSVAVVATSTAVALHAYANGTQTPVTSTNPGVSFTLTANVTAAAGSATVNGGHVSFYDSSTLLGTGTVNSSGVATVTVNTSAASLAIGKQYLLASYGGVYNGTGTAQFGSSLSASAPVSIVGLTALTITASSPSVAYGAAVPTITPIYSGWANGDSSTSLTTQATCTTAYTTASAPGSNPTTSCSGAKDPNYTITYAAGSVTVTQASQTIGHWFNSSTTYGVPVILSATATSGLTPSYSVISGPGAISGSTLTPSGVGTITIGATVAGNTNYTAVTTPVTKTVTVYLAPLVVTASSPVAIIYGASVPAITASYGGGLVNGDTALTTAPTCKTSYTVSSVPGSYSTYCYGAVDVNYSITYATGSLLVNKAPATVSVWPTASSVAYGAALSTSTLTGGTASVAGAFGWTTPSTIPHVGSSQSVTFTPTSSGNYTTATGTVAATVTPVTPTISVLPTATTIPYNSALSASKLNGGAASFTLPSSTVVAVPGTFGWTSGSTVLTTISTTNSEGVTFTPTGTYAADYNTATGNVNVTVTKATPTVSVWPTAGTITYGAALSTSSLTGGTASVAGAFGWASGASVPSAGTPSESVTFTPTNATDYSTVTGTVKVTVNKATLSITWPTASAITYPQTLASSNLTGGSTTGRFAWTSTTTVPNVGGPAQSVTFTPTNSTDYSTETNTVSITVNPEATSVSVWPTSDAIALGQTLADSGWATPGTASTDGSFAWTDTTIQPGVGTSSYSVTFTPSSSDFNTVSGWVNITDNACGFQDTPNSTFSTALNVETGNQTLTDPTLDAEGINESAVCDATPSDITIVTYPFITSNAASTWTADSSSYGTDAAVLAYGTAATAGTGATITINDDGAGDPGSISTSQNSSNGVFASMGGTVNITDTVINTSGNYAHALAATYAGTLNINNVQALTTGDNSSVIATGIDGGYVTVAGGSYTATSNGLRASGIRVAGTGSTVSVSDGTGSGTTIAAQNGSAVVIEGGNTVTINSNGSTSLSGAAGQQNNGIFLYQGTLGDATAGTGNFSMTNGSISYTCDATLTPSCAGGVASSDQNNPATMFSVTNTTAIIALTDVTVINDTPTSTNSNGTLLTSAALSQGVGGIVTFNAVGETLTGDIVVDSISTANVSLAADTATPAVASTLTGAINAANNGGTVNLTLDATSSWVAANGPSYLTSLTNAGTGNITCQTTSQCQVYVAGVLQASIQ